MSQSTSVSASSNPIRSSKSYNPFLSKNDHSKESLFQALLDLSAASSPSESLFLPNQVESETTSSMLNDQGQVEEDKNKTDDTDSTESQPSEDALKTTQPLLAICPACPEKPIEPKLASTEDNGKVAAKVGSANKVPTAESATDSPSAETTATKTTSTETAVADVGLDEKAIEASVEEVPSLEVEQAATWKPVADESSPEKRSKGDRPSTESDLHSPSAIAQGSESHSTGDESENSSSQSKIDVQQAGFTEKAEEQATVVSEGSNFDRKGRRAERLEENRSRDGDRQDSSNSNLTSASVDNQADQELALQDASLVNNSLPPQEIQPIDNRSTNAATVASISTAANVVNSNVTMTGRMDSASPPLNGNAQSIQSVQGSSGAGAAGQGISERYANASTRQTTGSGSSSPLTPRQEVRLVQRVMRGFEQLSNGEGQVKLRLHPPQLGSLQIQLRMDGSQMTARLEVENATAKEAILENLPKLRERLVEQGIQIEKFEVQVTERESQTGRQSNDQPNFNNSSDAHQTSDGGQAGFRRRSAGAWRSEMAIDSTARDNPTATSPRSYATRKSGLDLTA